MKNRTNEVYKSCCPNAQCRQAVLQRRPKQTKTRMVFVCSRCGTEWSMPIKFAQFVGKVAERVVT